MITLVFVFPPSLSHEQPSYLIAVANYIVELSYNGQGSSSCLYLQVLYSWIHFIWKREHSGIQIQHTILTQNPPLPAAWLSACQIVPLVKSAFNSHIRKERAYLFADKTIRSSAGLSITAISVSFHLSLE